MLEQGECVGEQSVAAAAAFSKGVPFDDACEQMGWSDSSTQTGPSENDRTGEERERDPVQQTRGDRLSSLIASLTSNVGKDLRESEQVEDEGVEDDLYDS
jgi:hypothetical protein